MINFLLDKKSYKKQKSRFLELFSNKSQFIDNKFNKDFKYFLAFEFDFIYDAKFSEGLKNYLKSLGLSCYTFYTINPSPEKYFYKHFSKYNIGIISINATDEELNDFLMRDPGGSPADALAINSQEVALFSDSNNWGIVASRDMEIGIIGFTSKMEVAHFLSSFGVDSDMFHNVTKQIEILDSMLGFNEFNKLYYKRLMENYLDINQAPAE